MGLVSGSIASLANGISQQPAWMRLPSQGAIQNNGYSSLVEGMKRRAPTEHVARLSATSFGDVFIHSIIRDTSQRYNVIFKNGDLFVYDLMGVAQTVAFPYGKAYLAALTPKTSFVATTIADFTFVANKEIAVTETNNGNIADNSYYAYVKQANYNCVYGVYIDSVLIASYTTAATGNAPQTDDIAANLKNSAATNLGAGWTVTRSGSVVRMKKNDNSIHNVSGYDSYGSLALTTFGRKIQQFVDLPPTGFDGATVEIVGTNATTFAGYWVAYNASDNSWDEVAKPEDIARPTPATMPWKLIRNVGGDWVFTMIDWGYRQCGDRKSSASPSFIGHSVSDMVIHRNRLFILSDQNVVGSRPGGLNLFNYFATTVTTTLASDPIDIGVSSNASAVPLARHAVPFNEDLLIFTDPAQFLLTGGDILSVESVKVTQTTNFTASLDAKPAASGKLVHFAVAKGTDSGVREFAVQSKVLVNDAHDITVHVPTYIKGTITKFAPAINLDTLFVLASGEKNSVWLYKWYIENDEKLQSSWSKWTFPSSDNVLSLSYMDSSLYLVIERATGVFLERVRLDASFDDTGVGFNIRLDRKAGVTGVYDAVNNWTTWTIPYDITGLSMVSVFGAGFTGRVGYETTATTVVDAAAGTVRILNKDYSTGVVYFGVRYELRYRLSTISLREKDSNGGSKAITDGRLQLRNIFINFGQTAYLRVEVSSPGRQMYAYTYLPNVLGQSFTVGEVHLVTGRFRAPIQAKNDQVTIDIVSDSHFPCAILSIDWEGEYTTRSQRT